MRKTLFSKEYRVLLELLRQARAQSRMTQGELALQLNTSQSFISKCERGERRLDFVELRAWCGALGVRFPVFVELFEKRVRAGD